MSSDHKFYKIRNSRSNQKAKHSLMHINSKIDAFLEQIKLETQTIFFPYIELSFHPILKYLIWNLVEKVVAILLKICHANALLTKFKIIIKI